MPRLAMTGVTDWTVLHLALKCRNIVPSLSDVTRLLLEHGADVNAKMGTQATLPRCI
jgi:ankyrin repeat protein